MANYKPIDPNNENHGLFIDQDTGNLVCLAQDGSTVVWQCNGTAFISALTQTFGAISASSVASTGAVSGVGGSFTGILKNTSVATTLGAAATTFAATSSKHVVTGDAGANTLATITGGSAGVVLDILFVDALVTVTDTDAATANTVNLKAPFVSTAGGVLTLIHNGTKWFEVSRSGCLPLEGGTLTGALSGTTASMSSTITAAGDVIRSGANGSALNVKTATTELTGLSGATATATNLIPAGSLVLGLSARVTTLIETATSFDIGDGTDVDAFGNNVAVAATTTTTLADWTITAAPIYTAATSVVLTGVGGEFSAGAVRLVLHYVDLTAPTS